MSNYSDEKLNIKVLIMYVLNKISFPVCKDDLVEICCSELESDYFSFSDCLYELIDSGHVSERKNLYSITTKGKNNIAAIYDSIPYSTRKKADKFALPLHNELRRQSMIIADHSQKGNNVMLHLELMDGKGSLMNLDLLCPSVSAAETIEKKFKTDAENYYLQIIELFNK